MQKGTAIYGGAATEEVLESSDHILKPGSFGSGQKGLQQFFTPECVAELAFDVIGNSVPVFDPTAGDGSFLKRFDKVNSFGVEIDKDQIEASDGSYNAIQGDIQRVFPLLYRVCPSFPAVVANPPFGLKDWADETVNDGRPVGSVRLTFEYVQRILQEDGQFIFICGKDQFHREIAGKENAKGVYYLIECDDLFEGTTHPAAIAFGVHPSLREDSDGAFTEGFETREVERSMIDLLAQKVTQARDNAIGHNGVCDYVWRGRQWVDAFPAVQQEHNRRLAREKEHKNRRYFDIELVGGKVLNVEPTPYVTLALSKHRLLDDIKGLHRKALSWFATYERDWRVVEEAMALGIISVDPRVIEAVETVLHETRRVVTPLYPIKETQRLGYLTDLNTIICKESDPGRGYVKGEGYPIVCRTMTQTTKLTKPVQIKKGENAGEWKNGEFEQQRKVLRITIGGHHFHDSREHQEDISYLTKHFDLPDPGDVGTRYPVETDFWRDQLREVEKRVIENSKAYAEKHPKQRPIEKLRHFQIEDIARLLVKESGLLAWEQGLGKTIGGSIWAEANIVAGRTRDQVLIIAPQDLIPQWQREVERILGKKLTHIKTHGQAKQIAKYLKSGGTGWYITHYEALAVNGTAKSELLPEIIVETKEEHIKEKWTGRWISGAILVRQIGEQTQKVQAVSSEQYRAMDYDDERTCFHVPPGWEKEGRIEPPTDGNDIVRRYAYVKPLFRTVVKNITSKHICPNCRADRKEGWNGKNCRAENDRGETCNYSHYLHRVKPMGSLLSTAFRKGQIIVDEGTMIQGDYAERSKVVRGLKGRCRLLMTGTPVKNYISQAFWLLSWALGYQNNRWPYGYSDKGRFEDNHAVIQWAIVGGKKATRKVLAEVTNLSQLWRLLSSSVVRRRKEETGENLVPKVMHPITVPLGEAQREQMDKWLKDFHLFFAEKYPDSDVVKANAHELMAPMLGLGQKLDYVCTVPQGDPDWDWTQVEGVSSFTPANLRALHLTMALIKEGRKVILGSQLIAEAVFLTERLKEKGVNAVNFLNAAGDTLPPAQRAKAVEEFQNGDAQVLVATIQALRLGHNIDAASAVVVNGLPWSFDDWDQFIARAHRFTSKRQVDVYVTIPGAKPNSAQEQPTMTRRKWELLGQKGDAASLALDGRLIEAQIEEISEEEVTRQLIEAGVEATGDEIPEEDIEKLWEETAQIADFTYNPSLLEGDQPEVFPNPWPMMVEVLGDWTKTQAALPVEASESRYFEPLAKPVVMTLGALAYLPEENNFEWPTATPENSTGDPVDREEAAAPAPPPPASGTQVITQLRELGELHEAGVLTQEEFTEMKAALIAQMKAAVAKPQTTTPNGKADQMGLFEEVAA